MSKRRMFSKLSPSLHAWLRVTRSGSRVDAPADRYEPDASLGSLSPERGVRSDPLVVGRLQFRQDGEICDYARQSVYVLLTNDLDFPQILAHTKQDAPSVVLLRGEPLVPEVRGSALLGALQDCEAELNQGAIVTLDWTDKPRARVLPLR